MLFKLLTKSLGITSSEYNVHEKTLCSQPYVTMILDGDRSKWKKIQIDIAYTKRRMHLQVRIGKRKKHTAFEGQAGLPFQLGLVQWSSYSASDCKTSWTILMTISNWNWSLRNHVEAV